MNMQNDIAEVLVSEAEIRAKVIELGRRISSDFEGQDIVLVGLLRGAIVFLSDLMRTIDVPVLLDFIGISSYGDSTESGAVRLVMDLETDIAGRHVVVVEDIVDTGKTLFYLMENLRARQPASLRVCALLDKPDRRQVPIDVDYVGFEIPDKFVVGYGLDFAEGYRNLPFVGVLKEHLYRDVLTRGAILQQLNGYLKRDVTLSQLVSWSQAMLDEGDLSPDDESLLRDLVKRAGQAGSDTYGLTLEDCSEFLQRLDHELHISTGPLAR
jgi:hypoxanthine phosphoribosyltransferase